MRPSATFCCSSHRGLPAQFWPLFSHSPQSVSAIPRKAPHWPPMHPRSWSENFQGSAGAPCLSLSWEGHPYVTTGKPWAMKVCEHGKPKARQLLLVCRSRQHLLVPNHMREPKLHQTAVPDNSSHTEISLSFMWKYLRPLHWVGAGKAPVIHSHHIEVWEYQRDNYLTLFSEGGARPIKAIWERLDDSEASTAEGPSSDWPYPVSWRLKWKVSLGSFIAMSPVTEWEEMGSPSTGSPTSSTSAEALCPSCHARPQ